MPVPIPDRHRDVVRQAAKFGTTGLVNTGVSFATFNVALRIVAELPRPALVAQALGYSVGIATSFVLNSRWTFKDSRASRGALLRFLVLQAAVMAASSGAISWLVDGHGAHPQLSWLGVTVVATAANFLGQRQWVFPAGRPTQDRDHELTPADRHEPRQEGPA